MTEQNFSIVSILTSLIQAMTDHAERWLSQQPELPESTARIELFSPPFALFSPSVQNYQELTSRLAKYESSAENLELTSQLYESQRTRAEYFPEEDIIDAEWQEIPNLRMTEEGLAPIAKAIDKYGDIRRDIAERELSALINISQARQQTIRELQKEWIQATQDALQIKIQADWDLENWKGKWTLSETLQQFRKSDKGLKLFLAPLEISTDCPDSFQKNLNPEIRNEVNTFLRHERFSHIKSLKNSSKQFAIQADDVWSADFHGEYFKESVGKTEAIKLCELLFPLPVVVIYGEMIDTTLYIKVGFKGFFNDDFSEFSYSWQWKEFYDELCSSGNTKSESIKIVRNLIVFIYKLLATFWIDLYYILSDPQYPASLVHIEGSSFFKTRSDFQDLLKLSDAEFEKCKDWIKPCIDLLNKIQIEKEFNVIYSNLLHLKQKIDTSKKDNELYQKALGLAAKALELKPENAKVRLIEGQMFFDLGRHKDARRSSELAIEWNRTMPEAFDLRGEVLYHLKEYDEAESSFIDSLRLDPQNYKAYLRLSDIYYKASKYQDAIENHLQASNHNSQLEYKFDWCFRHGQLFASLKEHRKAVEFYNKAQNIYHSKFPADFYYFYGQSLTALGKDEEALQKYERGQELYPDDPSLLEKKARVYRKQKKREEEKQALTDFAKYRSLDDRDEKRLTEISREEAKEKSRLFLGIAFFLLLLSLIGSHLG